MYVTLALLRPQSLRRVCSLVKDQELSFEYTFMIRSDISVDTNGFKQTQNILNSTFLHLDFKLMSILSFCEKTVEGNSKFPK